MPNEINETLLTPEQFFEANSFASDYIRREDFLKYCEQLVYSMFLKCHLEDAFHEGRHTYKDFETFFHEYTTRQ